jgi:hypothetical protein
MKQEIKLYNGTVNGKKIHCYTDIKGNPILSNTGATGILDKSDGLVPWAVKLMGLYLLENYTGKTINSEIIEVAKKEWRKAKEKGAEIGTAVHDFIENWIKSKEKPKIPSDEKIRNGVIAFMKWIESNKLEFVCSERVVYSRKHNVVGKLDNIDHDLDDHYLALDDSKSSNGIYPEMVYQTAGYLMMIEEEIKYLLKIPFKSIKSKEDKRLVELYKKLGGIKKRRIIRFGKEDGEFEVREFANHKKDIQGFISALNLKKRTEELKKELKYGF